MRTPRVFRRPPLCLLLIAILGWVVAVAEGPVSIEVTADAGADGTRLVLRHSESIGYDILQEGTTVRIVYDQPVRVEPFAVPAGDTILRRFDITATDTLTFHTGDDYRAFENFELRHPFRLVLDLRGTRGRSSRDAGRKSIKTQLPGSGKRSGTVVVIDPGHGGVENGAVGPTGLREKEVTLDLARRLRRALQDEPGISVVLTRDDDRLVGLDERTAIANHNRADLFLSIHLNAAPRSRASGAETYFLSTDATDDDARTLAALENRASGVDAGKLPKGSDGDDLDLILWDLAQNQYLAESSLLAESVQTQLNLLTGTRNRGVRQAPFRVLMGATMPAILVEVGFISNAEEESRFRDGAYRGRTVEALTTAVKLYLSNLRRLSVQD
ncbi:MAG: N-acetylmuramoyl-L-alanine amidase [Acidobacteriota bacterium]|nr:N-acetylmuramoyl-L-alanine amidase [Acidobacteriota bacterium]MDH3785669.1 N-acetylmuramoyl-L-alanine amidase [Acidobacteriota bacterium]